MAVFRVAKTRDYTVMSNHHLRNCNLSLKAKGLLSQMLSLPEEWDYTLEGLTKINCDGKDAIRSAVQELEKSGYIQRRRTKESDGKFGGNEYVIYEQPLSAPPSSDFPTMDKPTLEKPSSDFPTMDKPTLEKPSLENPTQLNKDILNTNISKKAARKKSVPLTDGQLQTLCTEWVAGFNESRDAKNALYLALTGFYAPREKKKQEPARTMAAFTALTNRLVRFSEYSIPVMIDMLERATTAGWKSVFPLNGDGGQNRQSGSGRKEEWL